MSDSIGDKDALQELKPGQVLDGRFEVDGVIGVGGMGRVYKVRHLEWNRDFALKQPLSKNLRTTKDKELFLKEAESWIRLGVHRNIVRCWFVRPVGKVPGLFLDLMSGGSLKDKLDLKAIVPGQWDRILKVLLQILEGLIHAHAKGMVHRDLKPDNLMVHADGRVCITDFGLVKTLTDSDLTAGLQGPLPTDSTVTAGAIGTPRYGAPEQWLEPEAVGPATDLYSFGAVMYELMCGLGPFDTPEHRMDALQVIQHHIDAEPNDPLTIRDDIPPAMVALCMKLLSKAPQERPQRAADVLKTLTDILASRGVNYQRPAPLPAGERPDLLNNAAASLFSLGRTQKARQLLLQGLMIEAGHPECLYNLVQLDRREGKIGSREAHRRLKRAKAHFGLALLCIEEGRGERAADILKEIPEEEKSGLLHRLEGDALMYASRFEPAFRSYEKAEQQMPNDLPTKFRKELAKNSSLRKDGHVYFPPLRSFFRGKSHRPSVKIALSPDAEMLLSMDESEIVGLCFQEDRPHLKAKREVYAGPVLWSDANGSVLLIQERGAFEIWTLNQGRMLSRIDGVVLARDDKLQRLVILTAGGVMLMDRVRQQANQLTFPAEIEVSQVLAAFTGECGVGFLFPDGRLAALNESGQAVPLPWPPPSTKSQTSLHLCLGHDSAAVVYRSSLLRCFCLRENRITAEIELGFLPDSLRTDHSESLFVASWPKAHIMLDKYGQVVTQGEGPCALDFARKHCLVWANSCLRLYQLNPFQHLRTWGEKVPQPRRLQFSRDGRRALSMDEEGEYRVWEVDEESRVFERSLLMTPGQTYPELIDAFGRFTEKLQNAVHLYSEKNYYSAYQTLRDARETTGFQQAEDALKLQWDLCAELQREGLDAIWERLFIPDVLSGQLSDDSRHLILAKEHSVELFEVSGPRIDSILKVYPDFQPVSAHYLRSQSDSGLLLIVGLDGDLAYYKAATGELHFQSRIRTGRISSVQLCCGVALVQGMSGQIYSLDLGTASLSEPLPLKGSPLEKAFILDNKQALLCTHHHILQADLEAITTKATGLEELGEITFCSDHPGGKLRMTGFKDGRLMISLQKTGQSVFTTSLEGGSVTAAALNLETALGVSASEEGHLTFFDLSDGTVLDEFVAHADGVKELSITKDGRYLTTRSVSGQFRLWEVSWLLSDKPGTREIEWFPSSPLARLGKFFSRR